MKHFNFSSQCVLLLLAGLFFCPQSLQAELQKFTNVRLVEHEGNDGDSFRVKMNGEEVNLRLYYVDCPEMDTPMESDQRRVREQTRYWGLADAEQTMNFGRKSRDFTLEKLARPFTVHTAFASALGRSKEGRVYAFVTTSEGEDLATQLVKNGLARTRGIGRLTPDGVPRSEMIERLQDLELAAAMERTGIWAETDPQSLLEERRKEREEEDALKEFLFPDSHPEKPLDPNTADKEELQALPGIGPVLAGRIIENRPFKTVEDLIQVNGIGPIILEQIREHLLEPEHWEENITK